MPTVMIVGVLGFAVWTKNQLFRRKAIFLALGMTLFFGNFLIINKLFLIWEPEPVVINTLPTFDIGIILTGVTNHDKEPRDRVYFHKGADRVLHPLQLFKMGKIKKFLITGGSGRVTGEKLSEAVDLKNVLVMSGVPDSLIVLERDSRNTYENAQFTKRVLDSLGWQGSKLLITSAFHMPRSKACFDKANVATTIFPVDYYGGITTNTPDVWLVPNEKSFVYWNIMIHEWLGYIMYKMMGYA